MHRKQLFITISANAHFGMPLWTTTVLWILLSHRTRVYEIDELFINHLNSSHLETTPPWASPLWLEYDTLIKPWELHKMWFLINRSKYGYYSSDLFGTAVTLSERVANGGDRSKKWRFWCLHAMLFSWSIDKKTANADSTYIELVTISDYIQGLHDYVIALLRVPTI